MDPELYLLYQSQLCTLVALRELLCGQVVQNGHTPRTNLTLSRIDEQITRLRVKGVSL